MKLEDKIFLTHLKSRIEKSKIWVKSYNSKTHQTDLEWKGKFDPALLDPIHLAIDCDTTLKYLEDWISTKATKESKEQFKHLKQLHASALFYNPDFKNLQKDVAQFLTNLYSTEKTLEEPIIVVNFDDKKLIDKILEIHDTLGVKDYYEKVEKIIESWNDKNV